MTDEGLYSGLPAPTTATVTASPRTGTRFSDEVTVTLTVNPQVAIYYTTDGTAPTKTSAVYSAPLTFKNTTELRTLTVTDEGVEKLRLSSTPNVRQYRRSTVCSPLTITA